MSTASSNDSLYTYFNVAIKSIRQLLNTMEKTEFIIEYFTKYLDFFVYSYLLNTFLDSLSEKRSIKSIGLPNHELKRINLHFDMIRKQLTRLQKLQTLENIRQINRVISKLKLT